MQLKRIMPVGVLLTGVIAFGALLLQLPALALVVIAVQIIGTAGAMFFGRRRRNGQQTGPTPEARVARVLELNQSIQQLGGRVRSGQLKSALLRGCELVPEIMSYTKQHDPDHLASTAAQIGTYMQSVETALKQYVAMQEAPRVDTPRRLYEDGKILAQFPEFALTSKAQLEAGDLAAYRANLRVLQPMATKGIGR